jgi:hypothetical protein
VAFDHAPHGGILQIAEAIGLGRALGFEILGRATNSAKRTCWTLGSGVGLGVKTEP